MINICRSITSKTINKNLHQTQSRFISKYLQSLAETKTFNKESQTVKDSSSYNRYLQVIPALGIHLSLGSIYSFTLFNNPLTKVTGVVASHSTDWILGSVVPIYSMHLFMQGVAAAATSQFQNKVDVRLATTCGAFCQLAGWSIFALGVKLHILPLCQFGQGFVAGIGIGLSQIPPIVNLVRWFPDRKGLASGVVSMGFGGAAMLTSNFIKGLIDTFSKAPEQAGGLAIKDLVAESDKIFTYNGREVVWASSNEILTLPDTMQGLAEGFYQVGTGSTGLPETLVCLGGIQTTMMLASSFAFRRPNDDYEKQFNLASSTDGGVNTAMTAAEAFKTRDFQLMQMIFMSTACFGLSNLACSASYMNDIFKPMNPDYITNTFVKNQVVLLSFSNLFGRVGYGVVSEFIGRKNTFQIFSLGTVPAYFALPNIVNAYIANPDPIQVTMFIGSTMMTTSFLGATQALLPAYEADRFGAKELNVIHGRMLTAASIAALVGPRLAVAFRDNFKQAHLGDPHVNMALQQNDFFQTGSALMVGAIFCNLFIKDMSKTTEAMALNSKIADLEKQISELQFDLKVTGNELKEKEVKLNKLDKQKEKFLIMTKSGPSVAVSN